MQNRTPIGSQFLLHGKMCALSKRECFVREHFTACELVYFRHKVDLRIVAERILRD